MNGFGLAPIKGEGFLISYDAECIPDVSCFSSNWSILERGGAFLGRKDVAILIIESQRYFSGL